MNIVDIAWLAGILEGEGTFCVKCGPRTQTRLQLAMTDEDVVRRVAALFGGTNVRPQERRKEEWKIPYVTTLCKMNKVS